MIHDEQMWQETADQPEARVPWYIMASWAYYHLDEPILSDGAFDALAQGLLADWDYLQHPHKAYITEDDLAAGTLMLPANLYPSIAKDAAQRLIDGSLVVIPTPPARTVLGNIIEKLIYRGSG